MKDLFNRFLTEHQFNAVDGTAGGITILSFIKFLPELSAGLSVIWLILRIYVLVRDELVGKEKQDGNE